MNPAALRHMLMPVALHPDGIPLRVPAYEIGLADLRLIHGPAIEEIPHQQAAAQLLFKATGLETRDTCFIGHDDGRLEEGALWHAYLCRIKPPVRDRWQQASPQGPRVLRWIDLEMAETLKAPDAALLHWIRGLL